MNGRRRIYALLIGSLLLTMSAACATDDDTAPTPARAERQVRPQLVVATGVDAGRVDPPPRANIGFGGANASIFESLVGLGSDFKVLPSLATRWEFRAPNTWRFELRRDVTFHDGARFDARAVVYMVDELWSQNPGAAGILSLTRGSATPVDDFTVDLTPTNPNRRLPEQLVHPQFGVQAPGTFAGSGTTVANTPTGTGPFKFSSYRKDEALQVERFDGYWGAKPRVERMTFRFIPDSNARVLALKAGEVDAMYDIPREQAAQLANDRDIAVVKSPVGAYDAMLLNLKGPSAAYDILRDDKVRRALALAVDKATIVTNVWKGNAEVMQTLIPAPVLGPHASLVKGHPYDRARARQLLDEAGWVAGGDGMRSKGGRPLKLSLLVTNIDFHTPAPELIQAQLKEVGITTEIVAIANPAEYFERLAKSEGDIFLESGNQNDANPAFLGALFTAAPGGFKDYAASFGPGPRYDELFTRAIGAPETEEARRLAAEAMRVAVDEVVAAVPFAGIYRIWGLRKNVAGFTPHPSAQHQRWSEVYASQ